VDGRVPDAGTYALRATKVVGTATKAGYAAAAAVTAGATAGGVKLVAQ
jgi:hypothetical protein